MATTQLRVQVCEHCTDPEPGDTVRLTTSIFPWCAVCERYLPQWDISHELAIIAEPVDSEECDCGSHIRHHDGGNYHYSRWLVTETVGQVPWPDSIPA